MMYLDVTDLVRSIVNKWLRSFYCVKTCSESEPPNLKYTVEIHCSVEFLHQGIQVLYTGQNLAKCTHFLSHHVLGFHSFSFIFG